MFISAIIPSLNYIFPFLPGAFLGFNWSGWAWITMLVVTLGVLPSKGKVRFPILIWLPWIIYIFLYVLVDFSFFGFQLTLQYFLPILVGIQASKFVYDSDRIKWIFYWFVRLCLLYLILFAVGHLFRGGLTASVASVPMLLSILEYILLAMYFKNKQTKLLFFVGILFLVPIIDVTRMGMFVFLIGFIFHFGNSSIVSKIIYALVGGVFALVLFNTQAFQEKTFSAGKGNLSDLSVNHYSNDNLNNSGRTSLLDALESGLKENVLFGNGPRADLEALDFMGSGLTEVHNDYLSVRYNYGQFGLALLLVGLIGNFISVFLIKKKAEIILFLRSIILTLFIGFALFMYSDNVLKYTVFFPNIFFALIGIYYSVRSRKADLNFKI
jgi:uncharacterized membrane protein YuzA (DUF378 family)